MKNLNIFKFFLFLLTALFFVSCSTKEKVAVDPDNEFQSFSPKTEDLTAESEVIFNNIFRTTANSYTTYKNVKEKQKSVNKINDPGYRFENGLHIWEGSLLEPDPALAELYNGHYFRALKFFDEAGQLIEMADNAASMNFDIDITGIFGFTPSEPMGDKLILDLMGSWTNLLNPEPVLNASGTYEKMWIGLYNDVRTKIQYKAKVTVDNLKMLLVGDTYKYNGKVVAKWGDYTVMALCNNSNTAMVKVYNQFTLEKVYSIEIPDFSQWDFGIPM